MYATRAASTASLASRTSSEPGSYIVSCQIVLSSRSERISWTSPHLHLFSRLSKDVGSARPMVLSIRFCM